MHEKVSEYHKNDSRFKIKRVGVKFKDGICATLCLSSDLKATGIFVILLSQNGFESDRPETIS